MNVEIGPRYSFSGNICFEISVFFLCSAGMVQSGMGCQSMEQPVMGHLRLGSWEWDVRNRNGTARNGMARNWTASDGTSKAGKVGLGCQEMGLPGTGWLGMGQTVMGSSRKGK
jgi:hypothetical protein